jgi:hypothetical protein
MATNLGIKLTMDNGQYLAALAKAQNETAKHTKKMSKSFSSVGTLLKGVGIGAALRYIINETKDSQANFAKLTSVIRSTGGAAGVTAEEAQTLAKQLSAINAVDDDLIVGAESILLRFRSMSKDVFPQATQAALDLSAATGKNLTQAATTVGRAIDGDTRALNSLKEVGINFTKDQKKQIEIMFKTGKTAEAQKKIFDELNRTVGGQGAAQAGMLAGSLERIKIAAGNMAAAIGEKATPGLNSLANALSGAVKEGGFLNKEFEQFGRDISGMLHDIGLLILKFDQARAAMAYWFSSGKSVSERAKLKLEWLAAHDAIKKYNEEYKKAIENAKKPVKPKLSGVKSGGGGSSGDSDPGAPPWVAKLQKYSGMVTGFLSNIENMTSSLGDMFAQAATQQMAHLDSMRTTIGGYFDYAEKRALESAGIRKETQADTARRELRDLQRQYTRTANLTTKKNLKDQIAERRKEAIKLKIQEDFDNRRRKAETAMDIWKMMLTRRQFFRQQQMQYATTAMNMASGMLQAMVGGIATIPIPIFAGIALGAAMAAVVGALGGIQLGMISAQTPPMFARGAYDVPYTGPAIVHQGETILPVPFAETFRSIMEGSGQTRGGDTIVVQGSIVDHKGLLKAVNKGRNKQARRIGALGNYPMRSVYA